MRFIIDCGKNWDGYNGTKREYLLKLESLGFNIGHKPYFAMYGKTPRYITLDTHNTTGVDAGEIETVKTISFEEFLEAFKKDKENEK